MFLHLKNSYAVEGRVGAAFWWSAVAMLSSKDFVVWERDAKDLDVDDDLDSRASARRERTSVWSSCRVGVVGIVGVVALRCGVVRGVVGVVER